MTRPAFNLEAFLKRSWPLFVAGAVLVLGGFGIVYSLVIAGRVRVNAGDGTPIVTPTTTPVFVDVVPRRLDGVLVPKGEEALLPYAVMVENSPDARPLSGVSQANLVVEAPVEGGITRFMLVFDATTTVEQVGPVRSARPYYVELADALHAVYAHVGGSPEALEKIGSIAGFRNLDEFSSGGSFWRSSARLAPHNTYTNQERLAAAAERKAWEAASFTPWRYLSTTGTDRGDVATVSIPYGGSFNVTWTYDAEENRYVRTQAGVRQKDLDGTVVSTTNVVILRTEQQVLDDHGRLKVRTTGSGKGVLFRDGKRFDLTWRRSAGNWLSFESIEGGDILFQPGSTWISLVTSPEQFPANLETASSTSFEL
jgi:hypothetical protein